MSSGIKLATKFLVLIDVFREVFFIQFPPVHPSVSLLNRVLAAEQHKMGGLKVLNYAPGAMDTDMTARVRQHGGFSRSAPLADINESANKCVTLALGNTFKTGAHIDFYDTEWDAPEASSVA